MSAAGPIHSVPSIAPEVNAGKTSTPGRRITFTPKVFKISPPRPGIRNLSPFKSLTVLISLAYQPPI